MRCDILLSLYYASFYILHDTLHHTTNVDKGDINGTPQIFLNAFQGLRTSKEVVDIRFFFIVDVTAFYRTLSISASIFTQNRGVKLTSKATISFLVDKTNGFIPYKSKKYLKHEPRKRFYPLQVISSLYILSSFWIKIENIH